MPKLPNPAHNAYADDVYSVIRHVLQAIGEIDYQHEVEIHNIDKNSSDEAIKRSVKQKIRATYQTRRQSYIDLLHTLRVHQQP
jgi:hypothetical protein